MTRKDLAGRGHSVIEAMYSNCLEGLKNNTKNISQDNRWAGQDSNQGISKARNITTIPRI